MRLRGAMIYVKDLPRMAAFYETCLGFTPIEKTRMDTWVEFDAGGGLQFALHAIPAAIASQVEIASPPRPREQNPVKLFFEVEDLEAEIKRLTALRVTIFHRPWGTVDAVDPEGNIFQISSPNT